MNYAAEAADILPDFIENGQPITITRASDGTGEFDPATGAYKTVDPQIFTGYALATNYRQDLVDGTLIKKGDQLFTIAASGLGCVPLTTDTLTDVKGAVWTIIAVDVVSPAGVDLLYKVQGRK